MGEGGGVGGVTGGRGAVSVGVVMWQAARAATMWKSRAVVGITPGARGAVGVGGCAGGVGGGAGLCPWPAGPIGPAPKG